jgi:FixJ family two-component response regulator
MNILAHDEPVVFIVDDSAEVRAGLMALLETVGLQCKAFESPKDFLLEPPPLGPTCLILDVRLPDISGLDVQVELARGSRNIPIIMITGHGDIPMTVRAIQAGAVAFLTKPVREQDLIDAVNTALEKDRAHLNTDLKVRELRARYDSLTEREQEILPLITAGLLNKQIAHEVGLSEVTVKVHRHKLMSKMNARRLPDLVRMADELGLKALPHSEI